MRLRDLFRGQSSSHERKGTLSLSTSSLIPVLDASTFVHAAQDKDTDTLHKYLLAAKDQIDRISGFPPDQPDPSTKATALHVAVESANIRAIHMLLQADAQVNGTDSTFSTPLHIAAYIGHEEIVQILLSHGADMYKRDNTGRNSFHIAVSNGNIRLIQQFLVVNETEQDIVNVTDAQSWTPLMCACASNHPMVCAFLLSHNADLRAVNDRGMTVFHLAAFLGSSSILHELLTSSSNDEILLQAINQGDSRNQTALFYACIEGHLDIALTLLRVGANAYHLDNDAQTCLHAMLSSSIILKRHIQLFYSFIQFVDYRSNQDYLGRTLLDLAYLNQLKTIIQLLLLLNYNTNSDIVFNREESESLIYPKPKRTLSLRHICILNFKRSIVYHRKQRQSTQRELLKIALQQTFQLIPYQHSPTTKENRLIEKSSDDTSLLQPPQHHQQPNKYQKNHKTTKTLDKKMRKTANIFSPVTTTSSSTNKCSSQIDLQQAHSTWSTLTNKFKGQRLPPTTTTGTQQMPADQQLNSLELSTTNPMRNLALDLLTSPTKLDQLLDFPSVNNNQLLIDDLQTSIDTYSLTGPNVLNQS